MPTLDPTGLFEEIPTTLVEEQQLLMVATASTPAQSNERTLDVFIIVFSSRASYVRYKLRVQKKMWKPIALPNYQASRIALVVDKTIDTTPEDNIKSQYPPLRGLGEYYQSDVMLLLSPSQRSNFARIW